jgi:hypothetical protein
MESGSSLTRASTAVATMMSNTIAESTRTESVRRLRELIAALGRRVPQVQRVGEIAIAQAAAALRSEALNRIEELERDSPSGGDSLIA